MLETTGVHTQRGRFSVTIIFKTFNNTKSAKSGQ